MINKTHAQNIRVKIKSDYIGKKEFYLILNWTYWGSRFVRQDFGAAFNQFSVKPHNAVVELRPSSFKKRKKSQKNYNQSFQKGNTKKYCKDLLKSYATIYYPIYLNNHYTYSTAMATQDDWQRRCAIVLSGKIVEMIHLS